MLELPLLIPSYQCFRKEAGFCDSEILAVTPASTKFLASRIALVQSCGKSLVSKRPERQGGTRPV